MGVKSSVDRRGPETAQSKHDAKPESKEINSEDEVMAFSPSPRGSPRSANVTRSPPKKQAKQFSHSELKLPIETIDFDVEQKREELMMMQDLESPSRDTARENSLKSFRK